MTNTEAEQTGGMRTVLTCPLCDWEHESAQAKYAASNQAAAPAVAAALGMPTGALLATYAHQMARTDEHALEQHLRTHGPHDWLPALMEARRALAIFTGSAMREGS